MGLFISTVFLAVVYNKISDFLIFFLIVESIMFNTLVLLVRETDST